jgi:hypothetical protein
MRDGIGPRACQILGVNIEANHSPNPLTQVQVDHIPLGAADLERGIVGRRLDQLSNNPVAAA